MNAPSEDAIFLSELRPRNDIVIVRGKFTNYSEPVLTEGYFGGVAVDSSGDQYILVLISSGREAQTVAYPMERIEYVRKRRRDYVDVDFTNTSPEDMVRDLQTMFTETHRSDT